MANTPNDKIYAYGMATKERDAGKDLDTLVAAGNNTPAGIWSDGTTMWVANYNIRRSVLNKIYAYDLATGERDGTKEFNKLSDPANITPRDMWSDGTTMWVADRLENKIYALDLATKEQDSDKDFDTLAAAGSLSPVGIWSDGTTMWVSDSVVARSTPTI